MAKIRISALAKELGVNSKDIIVKCKAEHIEDVETHQATVSAGLAATIRSWFDSGGAGSTAVETAEKVDVGAAKKRQEATAPRKRKAVGKAGEEPPAAVGSTATLEPVETATPAPAGATPSAPIAPAVVRPRAAAPTAPERPAAPGHTKSHADGGTEHAPAHPAKPTTPTHVVKPGPPPTMNVPRRPDAIRPAGERLTRPDKTAVSGPRVVREERPDPIGNRRPGPAGGSSFGGPRGPGVRPGPGSTGAGAGAGAPRFTSPDRRPGGAGVGDRRTPAARTGKAGRAEDAGKFEPWRAQDIIERENKLSHAGGFFKAHRTSRRPSAPIRGQVAAKPTGPVKIAAPFTVKELSAATGVKAGEILGKLLLAGVVTNINAVMDASRATELMALLGVQIEVTEARSASDAVLERATSRVRSDERGRAPVVTILGHVDHGKTSLLDRIRNANVAAGEAGGITQATSAFCVPVKAGDHERMVTFIDTPGHEAFTAMRARGARVTDIVVLVVAADDGLMPQSVESINHAKAARVPLVVALNKIDKPEATDSNLQRIFGQLAEHDLSPVEWGGKTELVRTSATKGTGIQELLDVLDYQAELLGLKADFGGHAQGTVLEARLVEGRGAVANVLVQEGVLRKGDHVAVGRSFGRVRDIVDDRGNRLEEVGPASPVAISGLELLPDAGDTFVVMDSMREAEAAAMEVRQTERQRELAAPKITLDNILEHIGKSKRKELPVVVKADVQGSVETLRALLPQIRHEDIGVSVKHCAVGGINESDVLLAQTTGAVVIGFNVTSSSKARAVAEAKGIDIRLYDVIYHLTENLEKAIAGLLDPVTKLEVLGHAEVRAVFKISKVGAVAGCYVTDGVIERNAQIRVTRGGIVVEKDRRLEQLKRFKDDAREVRSGMECGMKIVGYDDIREGDVLECYKVVTVERTEKAQ